MHGRGGALSNGVMHIAWQGAGRRELLLSSTCSPWIVLVLLCLYRMTDVFKTITRLVGTEGNFPALFGKRIKPFIKPPISEVN